MSGKLKEWLPLSLALCAAVALHAVLAHFTAIWSAICTFVGYFSPVVLGAVIAYLVNPLARWFRRRLFSRIRSEKRKRIYANCLGFITVLSLLALLLVILVPQMAEGVSAFLDNLDVYLDSVKSWLPELKPFGKALDLQKLLASREKLLTAVGEMIRNNADTFLETSARAGKGLLQWVVAMFLSMYFLAEKDRLKQGVHRFLRVTLPAKNYGAAVAFLRRCDSILSRFVVYNLIDSLIIGAANALFMAVTGIPYVGLISFLVAITNLIPTFGPIIGVAAGSLLLCLVRLRYAVVFLIFSILLQSFDAYILKPKLLGSSLGISGLWILISIIVGGRMFGALGMLLAVPAAAILGYLYSDHLLPKLESRRIRKGDAGSG